MLLIFCPVWRLEPEALVGLLHLEMEEEHHIVFGYGLPRRPGRRHHWEQYARAWQLARAGGYEMMLIVEADMLVPRNAYALLRESMTAHGYDAMGGLYVFRYCGGQEWNVDGGPDARARAIGRIQDSTRPGWGCFLVGPRGLAIDPPEWKPGQPHCDSLWYDAAKKAGLRIGLDGRVICGHKERNGVVYWPGEDGQTKRLKSSWGTLNYPWLEALRTGSAKVRPFTPFASNIRFQVDADGNWIVPAEVAVEWVDAGLVEEVT